MSWLSDFVAPKIKAFIGTENNSEQDKALWTKCPKCEKMIYTKELNENLMICGFCAHHFALPVQSRLKILFDDGTYNRIENIKIKDDPLKFRDSKRYVDRLKEARKRTGQEEASIAASGTIGSKSATIFVMDFAFMGGSMGLAVGKIFVNAVYEAIKNKTAFIAVTASGGARMQEGMLSLMQMSATISALSELKNQHKLPFINIFTHPTTGGVTASFAMLGDINIAETEALIGFAGARVIEKTIKRKLPKGFQKAEFLKEHGMIDLVLKRNELHSVLAVILSHLM